MKTNSTTVNSRAKGMASKVAATVKLASPKSSVNPSPKPPLKTAHKPLQVPSQLAASAVSAKSKASVKPAAVQRANTTAETPAAKAKHDKLVRDSFTIPKSEYVMLEALKLRAAKLARPTKKSEVLRAGIAALSALNDKAFLAALGNIPSLKTGRPKNDAS